MPRPTDPPERPARSRRPPAPPERERVQKVLARAGVASRRAVEDLIRDERVLVNGRLAELGDRIDPERDRVVVDGAPIPLHPSLRYFALNKPAGVTTTMRDPHAARSLADLLPEGPRVYPVGRLDRESEGLLLLMNDGELAHRLQHPRHGVEKEYLVEIDGVLPRSALARLRAGVELDDGFARPLRVGPLDRAGHRTAVRLVMGEGRKREIRRMFAALKAPVSRLVRVRVGPVRLGSLAPGKVRPLAGAEVAELYRASGLDRASPRRRSTGTRRRG
jgi:23S rRNA pseudouridine2605 synthase